MNSTLVELVDSRTPEKAGVELMLDGVPRVGDGVVYAAQLWRVTEVRWRNVAPVEVWAMPEHDVRGRG